VRITTVLVAVVALALAGCGDDDGETAEAPPEEKIEQAGNEWAGLFAAADSGECVELMTQPGCEQITCETNEGPVKNCTPPSSAFRESFADATVEDVAIQGEQAGATFSNGETVQLHHVPGPDLEDPQRLDSWLVDEFGGDAGREFFE
jgi:hypothetical protein